LNLDIRIGTQGEPTPGTAASSWTLLPEQFIFDRSIDHREPLPAFGQYIPFVPPRAARLHYAMLTARRRNLFMEYFRS